MGILDNVEMPKKTMVIFFVIDTSGSMEGSKIGAVNNACRELIPELMGLPVIGDDIQLKIAVLEYSTGVRWLTPEGPVDIERFKWPTLEPAGVTDFGAACKALNEKLSAKAFMTAPAGACAPLIIVTTDGEPTDNWEPCLAALKQNGWFRAAIKLGIAIGEDASRDVLAAFTGTKETVLNHFDTTFIMKCVKPISMASWCEMCYDGPADNKPRASGSSDDVW